MTTRKIYALCKKLGLSTTYLEEIGHGFWDEKEAEPYELENRIITTLRDRQLCWYEEELSRLVKKDNLHLCADLFIGEGLLVCDGGTKDNPWEGVTRFTRINPISELWELYQKDIDNGPKMPDLAAFKRHCKKLARGHWKGPDQAQWTAVA